MIATGSGNWQLRPSERVIKGNEALLGRKHQLVAMTRIRNEALILPDTLDYLADQVDAIVAYDDASTDDTVDIMRKHPKVALIVANQSWEQDVDARKRAEGRHRGLLLDMARAELPHDWMFCFDPDERVTGDVRNFVTGLEDRCVRRRARAIVRRLHDAGGLRAVQPGSASASLPPLLRARAAGHSHAVAQPPRDSLRRRAWSPSRSA